MQSNAHSILESARRQLARCRSTLDREVERIDQLECLIARLLSDPRGSIVTIRSGAAADRRLAARATRGASLILLKGPSSDGVRREVQIDDQTVRLPDKLAVLLEILAADEGEAPDQFVGWKSADAVWEMLAKRFPPRQESSRTPAQQRHTVDNLVSRLRDELSAQGFHRAFIQRNRQRGAIRFAALRRSALAEG